MNRASIFELINHALSIERVVYCFNKQNVATGLGFNVVNDSFKV